MMRSLTLFAGALVACGALLPVACGGNEETPPVQASPLDTEEGFCALFANAICTNAVAQACYGSDAASLPADLTACREAANRPEVCNPNGYAYNKAGAQACLTAAQAIYADGKLTLAEVDQANSTCALVFNGGGDEGVSCVSDADCAVASGLRCVVKGTDGTCQIPEEVGPGRSCAEPAQRCADDMGDQFFCSPDGACNERALAGDTCDPITKPCYDTANCANGVCVEKLANGDTCSNGAECLGGFCSKAANAATGTCSATLSLAPTTGNTCAPFLPPSSGTGGAPGTGGAGGAGGGTGGAMGGAGGAGGA